MTDKQKVECSECRYSRSAPYEARIAGCYKESNMPGRQKEAFLDEQQIPGDHERINLRGDCPDYEPIPKKPSIWKRLLAG